MKDIWESERIVAEVGARSHGILTSSDLTKAGVSPGALARLRRRGVVVSLGKGVDRLRDHPPDLASRCAAALALAGPGSVLGLRTAGRSHGCWAYRNFDDVEVLAPRGRDHRLEGARFVETRWLPPSHVTNLDGFPATTIGRTFFDLCGDPEPGLHLRHPVHERRMKQLYNDCLGRRGMTFAMEAAVHATLARRGRRGTRLVRELLLYFGPRHEATRSDVETLFFELVRSTDLPDPECQVVLADHAGFIGTVDFAWRSHRLVVEVDSTWHDGPLDRQVDAERDRRLVAAGYTVFRYRFGQIIADPGSIKRELAAILSG